MLESIGLVYQVRPALAWTNWDRVSSCQKVKPVSETHINDVNWLV